MNGILKYILFVLVTVVIAFFYLKPILTHENEYRIVVVNISERAVKEITLSGAGMKTVKIGPIQVGNMQDYYFTPSQEGTIYYSVFQDKQNIKGVVKENLKQNETGEMYIVIGEMHKVKVYDNYDAAY